MNKFELLKLSSDSLAFSDPWSWVPRHSGLGALKRKTRVNRAAILCWGKGAIRTWRALEATCDLSRVPSLVITPGGGDFYDPPRAHPGMHGVLRAEHPLPGEGSFQAGARLLEFFDDLRKREIQTLWVFLSGGASSLAWIPPAHVGKDELLRELDQLYRKPLSIRSLNRSRSRLCALKAGGAARWLQRIAPGTQARVWVTSDVAPYPVSVVGSGPFFDGSIPHRVIADNPAWVREARRIARYRHGVPVLLAQGAYCAHWQDWMKRIQSEAQKALRAEKSGLILLGGEPRVALPSHVKGGKVRGGRQSQLAAALALEFRSELASDRLEILCSSSDGQDGRSGGSQFFLAREQGALLQSPHRARELSSSLRNFSTGLALEKLQALIPEREGRANVQDLVFAWVK